MPFDNLVTKPNNLLCVLTYNEKRNNILKNDVETSVLKPCHKLLYGVSPHTDLKKVRIKQSVLLCPLLDLVLLWKSISWGPKRGRKYWISADQLWPIQWKKVSVLLWLWLPAFGGWFSDQGWRGEQDTEGNEIPFPFLNSFKTCSALWINYCFVYGRSWDFKIDKQLLTFLKKRLFILYWNIAH